MEAITPGSRATRKEIPIRLQPSHGYRYQLIIGSLSGAAESLTEMLRPNSPSRVPREFSKKAIVRDLQIRTGGATLQEIVDATGWQKHTVRGFISTLPKKTRIAISSTRRESDRARVYEVAK